VAVGITSRSWHKEIGSFRKNQPSIDGTGRGISETKQNSSVVDATWHQFSFAEIADYARLYAISLAARRVAPAILLDDTGGLLSVLNAARPLRYRHSSFLYPPVYLYGE
jgi:hypothetical protein